MTLPLVIIDPGHGLGTSDPDGSSGPLGQERPLVEAIAEHTRRILAASKVATMAPLVGAYSTRYGDDSHLADAAVQVHADICAAGVKTPYVLVLPRVGDSESRRLADALADALAGLPKVGRVIVGLAQTGQPEGHLYGSRIVDGVRVQTIAWGDRGQACIAALKCPAVLVEVAQLNRTEHAGIVADPGVAGAAIATGVLRYLEG